MNVKIDLVRLDELSDHLIAHLHDLIERFYRVNYLKNLLIILNEVSQEYLRWF